MFGWFKRKNKELKYDSIIEDLNDVFDECIELHKKYRWSEDKFDKEFNKRVMAKTHFSILELIESGILYGS